MTTKKKVEFEIEKIAYDKIYETLKKFGSFEIGGMLIGYKKEENYFSISDVTVADDIGKFNVSRFIREPMKSMKILIRLFKKQKHSYIGEWHSHPHFALYPSHGDITTMKGILADSGYGVNFTLLVIVRLNHGKMDMAGFLFHKKLSNIIQANIVNNFKGKTSIDIIS